MMDEVIKDFEDEVHARNIYLKQCGGRYCTFTCPRCGHSGAQMKMSANHGWCDMCDLQYQYLSLTPVSDGDPEKVDYYCDLQITS